MPHLASIAAGVECKVGLPGSGKSYMLVRRVMEAITVHRRPVFTNLPLRWRVMRHWLRNKGGAEFEGLLYPLTEGHFRAFLARSVRRTDLRTRWMRKRGERRRPPSEEAFKRVWVRIAGPDVVRGDGANWILPTAMIVVDECHHWFPASATIARKETPDLLSYLTMLRHYVHLFVWATQDRMQVSVTIRRLTRLTWFVRNMAEDRLAWGIKLGHLGVSAFAYVKMTDAQEEARTEEGRRPVGQEVVFPWLPRNRWVFRLYASFTHVGSMSSLRRSLERARAEAGLSSGGFLEAEIERSVRAKEARRPINMMKWFKRLVIRLAVLGVVLVVGIGVGVGSLGKPEAPANEGPETITEGAVVGPVADKPDVWPKIVSFSRDSIRTEAGRAKVGEQINGFDVLAVDVRGKRVILGRQHDVFVWGLGHETPSRVGTDGEIASRIRAALVAAGRGWGAPESAVRGIETGPMGPPTDQPVSGEPALR